MRCSTRTLPPARDYGAATLTGPSAPERRDVPALCLRAGATSGGGLPPLPFTVVVINEFMSWVTESAVLTYAVESLMRVAHLLGIHVLVVSHALDPIFEKRTGPHFAYRIAMGADRFRSSLTGSDAVELPAAPGSGLYLPSPGPEPIAFRGFKVSRDLVRNVGGDLGKHRGQAR